MRSKMTWSVGRTVAVVCVLAGVSSAWSGEKTIVETAKEAGQFNTLLNAARGAGILKALEGDGPITVFAPTDAAFDKLPKDLLGDLLKRSNKEKLAAILKYHVVPGKLMAADVTSATGAATLNGQWVEFAAHDGKVMLDNAQIIKTDIVCSNGVIHVIDKVILPASENIVATAKRAETFGTLLAAAEAAGLAETLANDGPFTVFAPTDEAFAKLPAGTVENLLKPENKEQLARILKFHVVAGRVYSVDAARAGKAETLAGKELVFGTSDGKLQVGSANITAANVDASNGVVHVIDQVLLP